MTLKSSTVTGLMLGVAIGLVLGTYVLSPNVPGGSNQDNNNAVAQLDQAREEAEHAKTQAETVDRYIASIAEGTVDATLIDRSVLADWLFAAHYREESIVKKWATDPLWQALKVAKENRVVSVEPDVWARSRGLYAAKIMAEQIRDAVLGAKP